VTVTTVQSGCDARRQYLPGAGCGDNLSMIGA
jgi:hypothetical protein